MPQNQIGQNGWPFLLRQPLRWLTIGIGFLILIGIIFSASHKNAAEKFQSQESIKTFAITWIGPPQSWDPLDFDSAQNLFVARMLYATPIEASPSGELTSRILKRFSVSSDSKTVRFELISNLRYADGCPLTALDLATAISRMAYARPKFPVLENLVGLDAWLANTDPLQTFPSGIEVRDGTVILHFSKAENKPLFRFALEPFAIIPRRCIDLKKNRLKCVRPPESGPYHLVGGKLGAPKLQFERRSTSEHIPARIDFIYPKPEDVFSLLDAKVSSSTVIFANDLDFKDTVLDRLREGYAFLPIAKSWHGFFLLNDASAFFTSKSCRQFFADQFRKQFKSLRLTSHPLEISIFTKLTAGYRAPKAFQREKPDGTNPQLCDLSSKGHRLRWTRRGARQEDFASVMNATCKAVGLNCAEVAQPNMPVRKLLDEGVDLVGASTGFWPQDPLGDLQMLFTPNLHLHLASIARDNVLQDTIRSARNLGTDPHALEAINTILYDRALYNIYTHHQYFYVAPKTQEKTLRTSPLGVTVPYPWQVFQL